MIPLLGLIIGPYVCCRLLEMALAQEQKKTAGAMMLAVLFFLALLPSGWATFELVNRGFSAGPNLP